ncbi:MAG TPA: glycosyltransferase [Terriglobales bacterium]|nr:glycosyltransferase [Terriglobales bacterium]
MTFVRTQAEALTRFSPYYISPHYLRDGLPLPMERVITMRRGKSAFSRLTELPFKALGVAPLFVRRLNRLGPALLHAHFGPAALRALPLARTLRIPLVVTFHGYDASVYDEFAHRSMHYSHRIYIRRRKALQRGAALLIAVSNFVRGELIRQGFSGEDVAVHYIGVDTDYFQPDAEVTREPIVLFAGRLAEKKGCEYLIRAMAKVQRASPNAELVIIGDGPLRRDLERLAAEKLRRYRFLGFQTPDIVKHWMNRSRVFGAPSVRAQSGDAEGYPIAFAEAQAMGLPVTSFSSDGVMEAVAHGETGLLAPPHDIEALAHNLQSLLVDNVLCARISAAARAHVCAQFDLRIQTGKLEELYMRVLGKAGPWPTGASRKVEHEERVAALDS